MPEFALVEKRVGLPYTPQPGASVAAKAVAGPRLVRSRENPPELRKTPCPCHTVDVSYDPDTEAFGPAKFVGFRAITAQSYELARAGDSTGSRFDGHVTRTAIERSLGRSFVPGPDLGAALQRWARESLGAAADNVLLNIDGGKWMFISLPAQHGIEYEIGRVYSRRDDIHSVLARSARAESRRWPRRLSSLSRGGEQLGQPATNSTNTSISARARGFGPRTIRARSGPVAGSRACSYRSRPETRRMPVCSATAREC